LDPVLVIGGGIGGLTLALSLHQAGIPCRVFEAAPEVKPLGVGINLLPHGTRELTELGLQDALAKVAVQTSALAFYNRFGQFIYSEPRGLRAGYEWPQFSIHRGDLHRVLLEAARARLGADAVALGARCAGIEQDAGGVTVRFENGATARGSCAVGCDGIHSVVRRQLFPGEGGPNFQGINMWRGVTRMKPFLGGSTMVTAGWLAVGKMVIYPIRNNVASAQGGEGGLQLINWVAEIQSPRNVMQDWSLPGRLEDFYPTFADWHFDWLDVAQLIRDADTILEYPMVDRDPLPWWTQGRITLLGDAAHPMYPRGSNGAGQAILDARTLAGCLKREAGIEAALKLYETLRLKATGDLVLMNRSNPPDAILREVWQRSGDKPFARIEDVISAEELAHMSAAYKKVAGFERESLARRASLV
jgi:2-polyprenyl-6-methoxyphenol hydroxylase-like FAD-dependent oxidoreductase